MWCKNSRLQKRLSHVDVGVHRIEKRVKEPAFLGLQAFLEVLLGCIAGSPRVGIGVESQVPQFGLEVLNVLPECHRTTELSKWGLGWSNSANGVHSLMALRVGGFVAAEGGQDSADAD